MQYTQVKKKLVGFTLVVVKADRHTTKLNSLPNFSAITYVHVCNVSKL